MYLYRHSQRHRAASSVCPASIRVVTPQNVCLSAGCVVVTFAAPLIADNFPGVTAVCCPASGSCFPVGATTVTCTATDASGNTASCQFTVTTFDLCVQHDSNPNTVLVFNSITGDYCFCCNGTTFTGKGTVTSQGCILQRSNTIRRDAG